MAAPHEIAGDLFRAGDEDPQYFPDFFAEGLTGSELVAIFGTLQSAAGPWTERDYVWHKERAVAVPVASVPNAAELVVSGEGHQFHVSINELVQRGVRLPQLGLFVAMGADGAGALAFHYRFDEGWSDEAVDALFDLLAEIREAAPRARFSFDTNFPEPKRNSFVTAIDAASEQRGGSVRAV